MGLFSFKKRSKPEPVQEPVLIELRIPRVNEPELTPQQLRQQLFDAASAGDEEKLTCLCKSHEKSIFEQGMIWSKVPAEIRTSPALLRWYGNGLKAVARYCADRLGKPELMNQVKEIETISSDQKIDDAKL